MKKAQLLAQQELLPSFFAQSVKSRIDNDGLGELQPGCTRTLHEWRSAEARATNVAFTPGPRNWEVAKFGGGFETAGF